MLALNAHRYRFRHREFHFALNWLGIYRFGGSQFSGMILSADFGGRTPVLSCSLSLEKSYSPSMLKCAQDWGKWTEIMRRNLLRSFRVLAAST